jgi:PAN domain
LKSDLENAARQCVGIAGALLLCAGAASGALTLPAWGLDRPSFDCSRATLADEKAICADTGLAVLERRSSDDFKRVHDQVDARRAREIALKALRNRRACKDSVDCIRETLSGAIRSYAELQTTAQTPAGDDTPTAETKADADSIEGRCAKKWDTEKDFSNSDYKACISDMTEARFSQLDGSTCDDRACYYRLSPVQVDGLTDDSSVFQGAGYFVRYKPADYGRDILVLDAKGGLTIFGQCGTCNGLEYASGPLSKAMLRAMTRDVILEVSRDQLADSPRADGAEIAATPAGSASFATQENRDYVGTDLRTIKNSTVEDCVSACSADADCQGLSYDKWNRYCFLKSAVTASRLDPRSVSGLLRSLPAVPPASSQIRMERYRGKTFPGESYMTLQGFEFSGCESACRDEASCVAYSYQKANGACRLFAKTGEYVPDPRNDSGIKAQP